MRTFIAIEIPKEFQKKIHDFQNSLKKLDIIEGNWTNQYHLTLKFLGEVDANKVKEVEKVLMDLAGRTKRFELSLQGIGAFPSKDFIRILWLGVGKGYEESLSLHEQVDENLEKLGFQKEKEYENHITLCRVQKVSDKAKLKDIISKGADFGTFEVSDIKLIKSSLASSGPVYEVLKVFKLA